MVDLPERAGVDEVPAGYLMTELGLLLDFKLDESYTPNKVAVRAGATFHDLKEIKCVELEEPAGWTMVPLRPPNHT